MRTFHILVWHPKRFRWLQYPAVEGPRALAGMEKLASRGQRVKAVTTANGITETLTLE